MSADCPFCAIAAGDLPARTVHQADTTMAFLDANPLAPGHTLVIPTDHHERVADLPATVAEDVMTTLHRVAPAVESAVDADGATIAFNDGTAAGQEVPHVHGHVVPRFEDDGAGPIHALFDSRPELADETLDRIADDVVDGLSER